MCVCIVSHREGDSILFYQREHEHDYSEHDEDDAGRAIEGFGLSLVREHCGDARPDESEHDPARARLRLQALDRSQNRASQFCPLVQRFLQDLNSIYYILYNVCLSGQRCKRKINYIPFYPTTTAHLDSRKNCGCFLFCGHMGNASKQLQWRRGSCIIN